MVYCCTYPCGLVATSEVVVFLVLGFCLLYIFSQVKSSQVKYFFVPFKGNVDATDE